MVYNTIWRGKPAVLKVLGSSTATQEVTNTRLIQSLKSKAPSDIAAYLPEIYQVGMVEHGGKQYGIIIMESLSKVPDSTKKELFDGLYKKDPARQREVLSDAGFVSHIVHGKVDTGQDYLDLSEVDRESLASACVRAFQTKVRELGDADNSNLVQTMVEYINEQTKLNISADILRSLIYSIFSEISHTRSIPLSHKEPYLSGSEGASLRKALDWLVRNGISWEDLHDGNLLQRDGQLVLIDFGYYKAESEVGPELPKYAFALFLI